ncbi:uncharacterized protein EI90DRAFT_3129477 [Cantharellus anzutake]|uniref:uncharacterized protein n=1 Tax=Cantharellus anzutake TaxID=1750568 RepID=UPI00190872EC|nr:uncharacterized protein EI90DRAFT_3129477 [Cantharellus anzutake]KAF8324746.1 hypothetical protein EI90DRAFT_3129477 [Cantharellus anzutake]
MPAPPDHQAYFIMRWPSYLLVMAHVRIRTSPADGCPSTYCRAPGSHTARPAASISPVPVESPTPLTLALSTDSEPPTRPPSVPSYIESAPPTRPPSVSPPPLPPKDTSFMRASAFALPDSPHYPSIPSPSPRPHATQHQIFHEYPHIQPALRNKAKSVISLFKKPPAIEEAESESSPSERDEDVATLATVSEARSQYRRWGLSPHASIQDVAGWEESQWDEEEPSTPRAPTFDMYVPPVKSGSSSSPSPPRYGHGHTHGRSRSATIASSYAVSPPSTYSRNRPITSSPTMSTTRARSGSGAIPPKMQLYHHGMSVAPSASDNTVYHPSSVYSADEYESDSSVTTPVFPSNNPRRGFVY